MNHPVKADELQQVPAFRDMTDGQLDGLASIMLRQVYSPGQVIFIEGDQSESLWFVFEGRVKIIKQSLNGRVQGLCLMNRGKCFGGCPLFDMETNPATAQALDKTTLFILPKDALQQLRQHEPHLVKALLHIYSQRLEHLSHVTEVLGVWTVSDRINDCLIKYADLATEPSVVELTHERLAALSGTVREVVTRHLLELEKVGAIRNEMGRIIILNSASLHNPCACDGQTSSV
ncbi:MAG: Crp/Fnr family transcriptional regulator [Anaerolineae bacterium]|nr:Crp/Fnr family transcriptional regulator [Chloroflexota bacterium]MBK8138335.1 Crp/Fnr family transcriptional regulator [Chloroflexota bacterium]MBP6298440.1 Crp/Fnr family transcriptional regulator [Anaerolineae bacterium]